MAKILLIILAIIVVAPVILVALAVYAMRALRPKTRTNVIEGEVVSEKTGIEGK